MPGERRGERGGTLTNEERTDEIRISEGFKKSMIKLVKKREGFHRNISNSRGILARFESA